MGPYINEIVFTNTVKLRLPTTMRIYLVINISSEVSRTNKGIEDRKAKTNRS